MARRRVAAGLALSAALAGCSFAPPYHPPTLAPVAAFKEAGPWASAVPADQAPRGSWWQVYKDTTLDRLERKLDSDNPDLAASLARYDAARAYVAQARGSLFPSVGVNAQVTDNRQSDNRPLRGANQPDLYPADTVGGVVSYELDLWGRVRNAVAARRAEAQASADDEAAAKLSLETQLADTYISLCGYDQQIRLLTATVQAFAQADDMTQRRFAKGIVSGIDTGRSGAELAEAQAQLADLQAQRALVEHAIASLIGTPASLFALPVANAAPDLPPLPPMIASTLLERRPDVAAAERRMAAANAGIGVAKAAFFPAISLDAQGGFQNTGIPGLMTAPNIFWSIGPSAVLNLFDGGRRRAQLAIARANWTEATADYRTRALRAFQEVEDNLARLHFYGIEAEAENRAASQAGQTEHLSMNRYVKGAVSYLDVVTAQATALRARREALTINTQRLQASVNLIRALGGGWSAPGDAALQAAAAPSSSEHRAPSPQGDTAMAFPRTTTLLLATLAATAPALANDRLSFKKLEFQQPNDPLTSNFVVYTEVHHTPAVQLEPALATLRQAIPAGTSRADAERILIAAGAHCTVAATTGETCKYSGLQTVDENMDEVRWHVRLALADDKVSDIAVDREWQRH